MFRLRRFDKLVIPYAVTVFLAGASSRAQQAQVAAVVVSPVIEREITAGQTFVGTVMPQKKAVLGSAVDGRVVEFPVNQGDRIEEGQMLAQLLTDTIRLSVATAQAELELRKQQLAELENGTRPEEIEQARARMAASEARMNYTRARQARAERLTRESGAISVEERDEIVSLAIEAEQAHLEAQAAYQLAEKGPRAEQIAQARAQVAMSQATLDSLLDQLEKHTVRARFSGYVTAEHTEVGQWLKQGDPVAEVVALDEVEVIAHVVEQYVPHIHAGLAVNVEVPAIQGRILEGVVTAVVPQADVQARTFPVMVLVKNEVTDGEPLLKSGMLARVLLPTGHRQQASLVPKDALVLGGPQPLVFVVDRASPGADRGKARAVPVQLGIADGSWIHVTSGVQPGQSVIVKGNERMRPGMDVVIQQVVAPAQDASSRFPATGTEDQLP